MAIEPRHKVSDSAHCVEHAVLAHGIRLFLDAKKSHLNHLTLFINLFNEKRRSHRNEIGSRALNLSTLSKVQV